MSDVRGAPSFAEHVRNAWPAPYRGPESSTTSAPTHTCTVLRFETGADVALLREQGSSASGAAGMRRAAAGAPLVVQLRPVAFFRFLCQRRALSLGFPVLATHAEHDARALLQHVLFGAWPCDRRRILSSSARQARHRSLAFEAQVAMSLALACRHPLEELARALDTSPFHLAHVFRAEMGISLHRYLVQLRIVAALERLADGEPELSKLALELGFSHHSHFSSHFRRVIGHSPRVVRRLLTAEGAASPGAGSIA